MCRSATARKPGSPAEWSILSARRVFPSPRRNAAARCRQATASAKRSRPDPRTRSRPSRVRNRPSTNRRRCRPSGTSRRRSTHGRTQRAQAASMRPSIKAAMAKENAYRKADIAEIEHRRMKREAGILQDRIEILALERRVGNARERIRGHEDEEIKRGRDPGLHGERIGLEHAAADWCRNRRPARRKMRGSTPTASSSLRDCPRCW